MSGSLPTATPQKRRGKSKGNRSVRCIPGGNEAIWDKELHTALIEALNIYPPMGRQRIRPMHDGGEGPTSLGRCQLIQQYLMQRTGKNRTRKQISSRIQRLRRVHQDDPKMVDVLRVLPDIPQPLAPGMLLDLNDGSEAATRASPLVPATPPLLGSVKSSASSSPSNPFGGSCRSSASSSSVQSNGPSLSHFEAADLHVSISGDTEIGVSASGVKQEDVWSDLGDAGFDVSAPRVKQEDVWPDLGDAGMGASAPGAKQEDVWPDLGDAGIGVSAPDIKQEDVWPDLGDAGPGVSAPSIKQENVWPDPGDAGIGIKQEVWHDPGFSLFDRPVPSLSRRRMASNIPGFRFQLDLPPGPQISFTDSDYDFEEALTMSDETGPLSLAGHQFPYLSCHGHSAEPITPIDQIIHTPDLPPQVIRYDKRSAYQSRCEKDGLFSQPVTCVPSLSPYDPYPSPLLFAAAEYHSSKPSPFHTSRAQNYSFPSSPLASFCAGVQSASSCLVPLGPEGRQDATQTQDITHPAQLPRRLSYPCDARLLDPGLSLRMTSAAYPCPSEENYVTSTLGGLELAPPAVIRPFFTYDFQCPGSVSSPRISFDELAIPSVHYGPVSH